MRCPNGWDKPCFYQKHAKESLSEYIDRIDIREDGGKQPYMMANSVSAVVALLQMGVLEIHPWGSRAPKLDCPDRLVFDFDPDESLGWDKLVDAVTVLRKLLDTLELRSFLKTTGGKGLHVVVPLEPTRKWDEAKAFCKAIAELLVRTFPDRFTSKLSKSTRAGRIFVDYLRNAENATAIAAYSVRAKARAPVAMPVAWEQLKGDLRFDHFNVKNVPGLLRRRRRDPWAELTEVRQKLTDAMLRRSASADCGIADPRRTTMARPIWKGSINFGLVSVPVALYAAEQSHQLSFSMLDKRDFSPVGYKRYNKNSGKEVPWNDIVKGYEYEKDQYVVLSDEDFRRANVQQAKSVEIATFVDADSIPPQYFETPYYLVPGERGQKVYALLRETLRTTGKVGVGQVVIRTTQHLAAVVPVGEVLMMITLRYANSFGSTRSSIFRRCR